MVISSIHLLSKNPDPAEDEIRRGIAGNLCRCTGYHNIVLSVKAAASTMRQKGQAQY
jgi:carbon-monoxide dehydrogenase small subunit